MTYSDDTTTTLDTDNPEDKMVFLTRKDVQSYFDENGLPVRRPLSQRRRSLLDYLKGFFNS